MQQIVIRLIFPAILVLLGIAGCSEPVKAPELVSISGPTMGTSFNVKYFPSESPVSSASEIETQVNQLLNRVNQLMSTYLPDSELSRFNVSDVGQWFSISEETAAVIELAQQISEQTDGAFDITVATLVDLWGFGPAQRSAEPPGDQLIQQEMAKVGYRFLKLRNSPRSLLKESPVRVDLSAIAKGYAVDLLADYLDKIGISSYMVEVGGEIRARGLKPQQQPWRIAIESPVAEQRAVQRVIELTDTAIATSGDYRNYFEKDGVRYSHTIDPGTGYPIAHNLASVTVLSKTSARADALATAFTVMGMERSLSFANQYDVAAFFIVKEEAGFAEHSSNAFKRLLN